MKRRRAVSVFQAVQKSQYTAEGFSGVHQLPTEALIHVDKTLDLLGIPQVIRELDQFSLSVDYDPVQAYEAMKRINSQVTQFDSRQPERVDQMNRYAKIFFEYGGVDVLVRLLMLNACFPGMTKASQEKELHLRVKSVIVEILSRLITREIGPKVAAYLSEIDDLLNYLFSLMAFKKCYVNSCALIEDILQSRRTVFNLATVENIKSLIPCLDDEKLACFCRILAICVSDLDIYENKSSLYAQNKQKRSKGFINVRDVNQDLLLSVPDLVTRLVKIACAKPYVPRGSQSGNELESWMDWIDSTFASREEDSVDSDDFDDFVGGVSEPINASAPYILQQGIKVSNDLIQRVGVIYVIGLFLVGKHRKKIQKKLAEMRLIPGLNDLFDHFIWKCQNHRSSNRFRLRGHNSSCECSPEVALKIQFLRLVHAFCDHSEFKHLLLTRSELNEIKKINDRAGPLKLDNLDDINKDLMCRGRKGLLSKIVEVMKKEPTTSTFRFWLARAVESYLRGTTSYGDQMFLLRRDLLQHVAGNIVEHDIRPKEILQSSFDLLGELIKFNINAFRTFDKILDTETKFNKFISIINANLVDSNMFIRSLMLSYEHFTKTPASSAEYTVDNSQLLRYIGDFDRQLEYLQKLINIVNVEALTQENVSCLNTTLVFLMFANQKRELPDYLYGLSADRVVNAKQPSTSQQNAHQINSSVMKNFRDLLIFWQDHYLHKDKDCSALERSSRISFDYWKSTVSTLVCRDAQQTTAIAHYLPLGEIKEGDTSRCS